MKFLALFGGENITSAGEERRANDLNTMINLQVSMEMVLICDFFSTSAEEIRLRSTFGGWY